jgi:hypothetical protein
MLFRSILNLGYWDIGDWVDVDILVGLKWGFLEGFFMEGLAL